jgi:signal transduction histidine kinase
VASGYVTVRGIRRELAIARQQADFVAAVSHEFRAPLTSIVQLSRLLHEGRLSDESRRHQYYEALMSEGDRLHRLVEKLLSFGRAEAGRYRFEPLDASQLTVEVVNRFQKHNGIPDVRVSTSATPCPIRADREMLSLALWNLLDNAIKYSPSGRHVHVDVSRDSCRARIAVRDEGTGIAVQDRERIFERFVRGNKEMTGGTAGTGIGLALVRQVVTPHSGEVRLDSEVGLGSTFTIVIPAEAA